MIIYGAIAIIIYYLTYRYVPNELIENMLSLVVRDMNNGIICYDRKGRCIYYNDLMEAIYRHGGNMSVYESKYSQWIEKLGDDRRDSMTFQTTDIEINGEKHYFEIATSAYMMRAIALYVIILYTMTVHRCMSRGSRKSTRHRMTV